MFHIVMTNTYKHVSTIVHDSTHELNMIFNITPAIIFSHLIGLNFISIRELDPMSQISYLLIYLCVIVSNTICTNGQALAIFYKQGSNRK